MKYPHTAQIKNALKDKADFVQKDGLNYLIPAWLRFADKYADSEDYIYEWMNDMSMRQIIDEILEVLLEDERNKVELDLKPIDEKVMALTFEINESVWDSKDAPNNQYDRKKYWYYYRINQKVFANEPGRFTRRH